MVVQLFQRYLLKGLLFVCWIAFGSFCQRSVDYICVDLFLAFLLCPIDLFVYSFISTTLFGSCSFMVNLKLGSVRLHCFSSSVLCFYLRLFFLPYMVTIFIKAIERFPWWAQEVKDPALSLLWQTWSLANELPHAGVAKKKERKKEKKLAFMNWPSILQPWCNNLLLVPWDFCVRSLRSST